MSTTVPDSAGGCQSGIIARGSIIEYTLIPSTVLTGKAIKPDPSSLLFHRRI